MSDKITPDADAAAPGGSVNGRRELDTIISKSSVPQDLAAAGVVDLGDERLRRRVSVLHRAGPRAIYELLVEIGATRIRRTEIETAVASYAASVGSLDLTAIGADHLPSPVVELLDLARRALRDAEAAGLNDSAAWSVNRAIASLDEVLDAISADRP